MKFGSVWVSPGRREFELESWLVHGRVDVPWLWIERGLRERTVLWGGHPDLDVWVGSPRDRARERYRWYRVRAARTMVHMTLVLRDRATPALRKLAEDTSRTERLLRGLRGAL